jgi:hypothetical protein
MNGMKIFESSSIINNNKTDNNYAVTAGSVSKLFFCDSLIIV